VAERKNAANKVLSAKVPAWIKYAGGKLSLVPQHATAVRRIFAPSLDGLGGDTIANEPNAERVSLMGRTTYGGSAVKKWTRIIVNNIPRSRATYAE
jgi:hypothetical protein